MDFEYNADANFKIDADKARDCLRVQNFVKLNQVLRPIIPFLKEARDAIEIADFFHLNFKLVHQSTAENNESIKSNKHLALERFKNVQSKKGNPILHVDDLPFGRLIIKNLVASRSIDYISNVFNRFFGYLTKSTPNFLQYACGIPSKTTDFDSESNAIT